MRKLYTYILVALGALAIMSTTSLAQQTSPVPGTGNPPGLNLQKFVTKIDDNGRYDLTLKAYVTGSSTTTEVTEVKPADIIIILDLSSSMTSNYVNVETSRTDMTSGSSLSTSSTYIATIDGKEYYLKGFSESDGWFSSKYYYRYGTTEPSSRYDGSEFFTGSSDYVVGRSTASGVGTVTKIVRINTERITRLEAIKRASKTFVDTIYSNSPTGTEKHKLAVVGYNSKGKTFVSLQNVTSSSATTMKNTIDGIFTDSIKDGSSSYTNPTQGLKEAVTIFNAVKDDGRKKVVVFFTDGDPCPSGTNNFSTVYATSAVNWAYILKQPMTQNINYRYKDSYTNGRTSSADDTYSGTGFGASVYSVAVLGDEDTEIRHFLHWVSSNYPDKYFGNSRGSFTGTGAGNEDPHDYYQLSDGSDLTAIFDKIAHEASEVSDVMELGSTTSAIIDVVATDFKLPEGADAPNIRVYTAPALDQAPYDSAGRYWYKFGDRILYPDATIEVGTDTDGNPKVKVYGFDYSKKDTSLAAHDGNWVGPRKEGETIKGYYGNELIITIPIQVKPDYAGGYGDVTNTTESGIYKDGETDPIGQFPVPEVDFPSIGIIKEGLAKGESATFTVLQIKDKNNVSVVGATPFTIILTGDGTDKPAYAIIKNIPEGTYRVAESKWSWTYKVTGVSVKTGDKVTNLDPEEAEATTQVLEKNQTESWPSVIRENVKCVLFTFTNAKKSGDDGTIYAESVVKNKFKGGTNTTTGHKTTSSKVQPTTSR